MQYKSRITLLRTLLDKRRDDGKISDADVLQTLSVCSRDHAGEYHRAAEARRAFHRKIAEKAEKGKIAMVWSGMDCDCVRYQGEVRIVRATWRAIDAAADETYKWADGPCGFYLEKPSVAKKIQYSSRDLAMEAYEDGHPHVIYG